ncbi:MAG: hypothetical protein HY376_03205 [Candidatus Blackburnbacteria bacterium]|nr:hypothetical protein [Candidatus Blackburnbacteria bacterium]
MTADLPTLKEEIGKLRPNVFRTDADYKADKIIDEVLEVQERVVKAHAAAHQKDVKKYESPMHHYHCWHSRAEGARDAMLGLIKAGLTMKDVEAVRE